MELEHTTTSPHPPATLWPRLCRAEAWPTWARGVAAVALERGDGGQRGDLLRVSIDHEGVRASLEGEVTAVDPESTHRHRLWNEQLEVVTTTRLEPDGRGSKLHQHVEVTIHAFALQLLAKKIRSKLEEKQRADLAALAAPDA